MINNFLYFRPEAEDEVIERLKQYAAESKILAGGTDLLIYMKQYSLLPSVLIDIKGIKDLSKIDLDSDGNLIINAAVTCNDLIENNYIRKHYPVLAEAAHTIGSYQIRNRATIVGNICNASPAADMAGPLLVLDAAVVIHNGESIYEVPIKNFFTGVKKTVLKPTEYVKAIKVPGKYKDKESGYLKASRIKGHDLGICNVAVSKNNGTVKVAIGSCNITPVLLPDFESKQLDVKEVIDVAMKNINPIDDVRGSKEYRRHLVKVFIKRLLTKEEISH